MERKLLGLLSLWLTAAAALADGLHMIQAEGVVSRGGSRQLQQTFGSSSIVPLVVDQSPCISFNAEDAVPVLNNQESIVGYATVHSNGYDKTGLSVLRLDIASLVAGQFFAGPAAGMADPSNVRATLTTAVPTACPANASDAFTEGTQVDCSKRRTTLDISVPPQLFNCTAATTEDFSLVMFLQIEMDFAPQTCTAAESTLYAGSAYNRVEPGCSYIMVTAACKPSTCDIDTSVSPDDPLASALGSGLSRSSRLRAAAAATEQSAISGRAALIIGILAGGVLLLAAFIVGYFAFRHSTRHQRRHRRATMYRSKSVASAYLDADRLDSFMSIHPGKPYRGDGGGASSEDREDAAPPPGAGRWRDKFGVPDTPVASSTSSKGAGAIPRAQLMNPFYPFRPPTAESVLGSTAPGAVPLPAIDEDDMVGAPVSGSVGGGRRGSVFFAPPAHPALGLHSNDSAMSELCGPAISISLNNQGGRGLNSRGTAAAYAAMAAMPGDHHEVLGANMYLNPLAFFRNQSTTSQVGRQQVVRSLLNSFATRGNSISQRLASIRNSITGGQGGHTPATTPARMQATPSPRRGSAGSGMPTALPSTGRRGAAVGNVTAPIQEEHASEVGEGDASDYGSPAHGSSGRSAGRRLPWRPSAPGPVAEGIVGGEALAPRPIVLPPPPARSPLIGPVVLPPAGRAPAGGPVVPPLRPPQLVLPPSPLTPSQSAQLPLPQ